ncbi:phosphatase PAP2 family protein [Aureimonas endophytica]|uniref:Phosphatase PAP2 family protein n=1 Tax=Aureimonas endophytica TaxID=2027858 RepID=A0A916ZBN6_9HYPH|nr:phosphatase PAP2 family protein [Aureimonas endophytica]GGD86265.1 phosphatase PAP2 family protein [Aureimonas endophytica]
MDGRKLYRMGIRGPGRLVGWASHLVGTPTLLVLLGISGAIGFFIFLAEDVAEGETLAFDRAVLLALRNPLDPQMPFGPGWFQELMRDFTGFGSVGILSLVTLAAAGLLYIQHQRRSLFLTIAAIASGMVVSSLLKAGFDRPRPDLVPHGSITYTASFPSGHALLSAVTYLTLAALVARVQPSRGLKVYIFALAALLTIVVGISRVYLGVHWPSDVAAGWAVGSAWALLWWLIARWLERRGVVEPERTEPQAAGETPS